MTNSRTGAGGCSQCQMNFSFRNVKVADFFNTQITLLMHISLELEISASELFTAT